MASKKGKEKENQGVLQNKNEDPGAFLKWALEYNAASSDYLKWAKETNNVKVTSAQVPEGILPKYCREASLHDVRVFSKKRVPDDKLYSNSKQLRDKVARGNSLLTMKVRSLDGEIIHITCFLIFALRKFTGGMGDDDDEDNYSRDLWKSFFLAPEEKTVRVISTVKENGAAAHLSCFEIYGEKFLIAGSKNVHLILRKKEDLLLYKDERFKVARIVAETVIDQISQLEEGSKRGLLEYLCTTHYTASFELIDPNDQHVELIDLPAPELRFLAFSSFWESEKTICIDPLMGYKKMTNFGFKVTGHDVHNLKSDSETPIDVQLDPVFTSIRKIHGSEGKVLYFLDQEHHVIGLLKKKSAWYIILRALREKAKQYLFKKDTGGSKGGHNEEIRDHLKEKIRRRIKEVQKWLNFSQENLEEWVSLGLKFNDWLCQELSGGTILTESLADTFPVVWNRFLKETGSSDHIEFVGSGF